MVYVIEPTDHWKAGDRAYCTRGLKRDGRWIVETGRMYRVAEARQYDGMMPDGLKLEGVDVGDGFWSSRFVCIRGRELPARQIKRRTRHAWMDAYATTSNERAVADGKPPCFPPEYFGRAA